MLLGITGKDFTIIAASKAAMRGATVLKASDDKTRPLSKHILMALTGEAGDTSMLPPKLCPPPHLSLLTHRLQSNSPNTSKQTSSCTACATTSSSTHQPPLHSSVQSSQRPLDQDVHTLSTSCWVATIQSTTSPLCTGSTIWLHPLLSHTPLTATHSTTVFQRSTSTTTPIFPSSRA